MPSNKGLDYFTPAGEPLKQLDPPITEQAVGPVPIFRSAGAYGTGTTQCTAAVPTGGAAPQANDTLVILAESTDSTTAAGTPNTPGGWSKLFERTQGDGLTGVTTLTIFGKRAGAGETDVTIDGVLNHISARMFVVSGGIETGDAWTVGSGNGADTGNGTCPSLTTPTDNCLVLAIGCSTRDNINSANFTLWTNANLSSLTERGDNGTNVGAGGGIGVAMGGLALAGPTGNTTFQINVSDRWNAVHIALRPPEVAQAPRSSSMFRMRRATA